MSFDLMKMFRDITSSQEAMGLKAFDKGYEFYFDETNNIREFSLNPTKSSRVNTEDGLNSDFILGGICFKNKPDCDELFKQLKLQSSAKELKSKHIFRYNNYPIDFSGERATALLKWLEINQDVYLHYAIENNLYFALVDIVDSLLDDYPHMIEYIFQLKDALYKVCKDNQNEVLELLCEYKFPDVHKSFLRDFTRKLSQIIDSADSRENFYVESLRQMLKTSREMPFIVDNEPFILQNSYSTIYMQRIATFYDSALFFDEEAKVIEELSLSANSGDTAHCTFVDSTTERFIQISDCVIACLSKTFTFLDGIEWSTIAHFEVTKGLRGNLRRLKMLIDRSDNKNPLLIMNLNAQSLTIERYRKLSFLCK